MGNAELGVLEICKRDALVDQVMGRVVNLIIPKALETRGLKLQGRLQCVSDHGDGSFGTVEYYGRVTRPNTTIYVISHPEVSVDYEGLGCLEIRIEEIDPYKLVHVLRYDLSKVFQITIDEEAFKQ